MKVEVDLEDLETIIFATAVIKSIEGQLAQRKSDPFVQPHLEYTQAHNNLVAAMNSAKRSQSKDTVIGWDDPLTNEEIAHLNWFLDGNNQIDPIFEIPAAARIPGEGEIMSVWDSLVSKGMIRIGQGVIGAVWPGITKADLKPREVYVLAITPRGREKLNARI